MKNQDSSYIFPWTPGKNPVFFLIRFLYDWRKKVHIIGGNGWHHHHLDAKGMLEVEKGVAMKSIVLL